MNMFSVFAVYFHEIFMRTDSNKNKKARCLNTRLYYMDGLVSTGNQIPYHNIKFFFCYKENIFQLFY